MTNKLYRYLGLRKAAQALQRHGDASIEYVLAEMDLLRDRMNDKEIKTLDLVESTKQDQS